MTKSQRRLDIDDDVWARVQSRIPALTLGIVLNSLLSAFADVLEEEEATLDPLFLKAAEIAKKNLNGD